MNGVEKKTPSGLTALTNVWLGLVALTLVSLGLGQWFHGKPWLQLLVAALVWLKGHVVARRFIEVESCHPFIRRVVNGFVAVTPLALLGLAYFGAQLARWATL